MYDDDGESYAYEQGAVCSTLFECTRQGRGIEVRVNPVKGSYEGMPEERNYAFDIRCTSKPRKVSVNGEKIKDWTWEDNTLKVPARQTAVSQNLTLKVTL